MANWARSPPRAGLRKTLNRWIKPAKAILELKPVTFHYKNQDTKKAEDTTQFGLIAEEVAEVDSDLVTRDKRR